MYTANHENMYNVLLSNYIKYDRLYEMTMFAIRPERGSCVNIFIDMYSLVRQLYNRFGNIMIKDSYAIASSFINLAAHLRAYFETRHGTFSKIYIVYGGARQNTIMAPDGTVNQMNGYNEKNILIENSNSILTNLLEDNIKVMQIICPYLNDIFCISDIDNEFITITSKIIEMNNNNIPNVIYSKDIMSYQLVPFKRRTFLYRPKRKNYLNDVSWVTTKSTLYEAYRYGELALQNKEGVYTGSTSMNINAFSIYLAIAGVKTRGLSSLKNANVAFNLLNTAINNGLFRDGYNTSSIYRAGGEPLLTLMNDSNKGMEAMQRLMHIDLNYLDLVINDTNIKNNIIQNCINLYNPDEVRYINNKYFVDYPLDLNRI